MRKNTILLNSFCLIIFLFFQTNLNAQGKKVKYNVKGNVNTYYMLSNDTVTHFSVKGPGKLTITTRARFSNESSDSLSYSIVYQADKMKIKVYNVKKVVREGSDVFIQSITAVPSTSKTFTIKVGPGVHNYSFIMLNKSPQVDLHYKFVADSVVEWKDIYSLNDTSKVKIKADKSSIQSYYRFSSVFPQKFKVKGPASLRILTRLEYDYTMQGSISYCVSVKRNDTIIGTYKFEGIPSVEAQYLNDKKHVPGTLKKFFIKVPAGYNNYEFSLLDKQFTSLIRVSRKK